MKRKGARILIPKTAAPCQAENKTFLLGEIA